MKGAHASARTAAMCVAQARVEHWNIATAGSARTYQRTKLAEYDIGSCFTETQPGER